MTGANLPSWISALIRCALCLRFLEKATDACSGLRYASISLGVIRIGVRYNLLVSPSKPALLRMASAAPKRGWNAAISRIVSEFSANVLLAVSLEDVTSCSAAVEGDRQRFFSWQKLQSAWQRYPPPPVPTWQ